MRDAELSGRSWLVVGAGYVGTRLCRFLLDKGARVSATRRGETRCQALRDALPGVEVIDFALGQPAPRTQADVVVITAPPSEGHPESEAALAKAFASSRVIYLSTTGVYAEGKGGAVADDFPVGPLSDRGQARLDVEEALRAVHSDAFCLRVPGIYGPERGVLARMLAGRYRVIGEGTSLVSRIHVDDLIAAICLLGIADTEERVFVVGDDEPTSSLDHAMGVAERMGLPPPPQVGFDEVPQEVRAMLGADRGVVAERLKALGWTPRYPSWREGLEQIIAEEGL